MNIEEQISIILKGAAQHSEPEEIRQKLMDANGRPLRVKFGLDPSAPDIHLGHAVPLRKLWQLQELGATAVIVIGDFTGQIGDPTGKSQTRQELSREQVAKNAQTYFEQIFRILDRIRTEVHYNSEWLSKMTFTDVVKLASKCTVARILERDDFKNRFEQHRPLSMHELLYPLIQAFDSVAVRADVELGGTDQTFNILLGRSIQRDYGLSPQLVLFMPLLEGTDGVEKMSKSLGNYIGITENPSVIYEKTMRIPDSLILRYFELCTDLHPNEIKKIADELEHGANPRDIKMRLSGIITALYSSEQESEAAAERFRKAFQRDELPEDAVCINLILKDDEPHGLRLIRTLVAEGHFSSASEIRRLFKQGGIRLDGKQITDPDTVSFSTGEHSLRAGKGKFFRIVVDKTN